MNYGSVCNKLDALMSELLNKGVKVPEQFAESLNSVRSLIQIYSRSPDKLHSLIDKSTELQTAEMNLVILAEASFGKDYADAWQQKISAAYKDENLSQEKASRYVSGVPKDRYWVRLKTGDIAEGAGLDGLLKELNLETRTESDGYLLIHGRKEDVKTLLNNIRQKIGK